MKPHSPAAGGRVAAASVLVLLLSQILGAPAESQPPPESPASPPRLEDFAWLEGTWEGSLDVGDGTALAEVQYLPPEGGVIQGSFRLTKDGSVIVLELVSLVELEDRIEMRFRHFNRLLEPWEKEDPIVLTLEKATDNLFTFRNHVNDSPRWSFLENLGPDRHRVRSEIYSKDGELSEIEIVYQRRRSKEVSAAESAAPAESIVIETVQDSEASKTTRDQLQNLLGTYPLEPWLFTRRIVVDEETRIPHSHPVLTLSTRHTKDDDLLLSTFVHEQLHWYVGERSEAVSAAVEELKREFPGAPVGGREGGYDERSSYTHLIVCYLEKRALQQLLGELRSKQVMEFWATDHYTWIYDKVIHRGFDLYQILDRHGLLYPKADS
jgi:hypothetical protein